MNANAELSKIRARLSHVAMKWRESEWLDLKKYIGDDMGRRVNTVLGHTEKGMPYGRIIEVSGWESHGKTAVTLTLAACAQRDGAHVIYGDVENSFEADWAIMRGMAKCPKCLNDPVKRDACKVCGGQGIDVDRITLIQPYVGNFTYVNKQGKVVPEKEPRQSTAQELCSEIEECMKLKRREGKTFVVIDSIAALLTEEEDVAGIENAKMNTKMALAMFLGRLLRRWVGLAQVHNSMIVLINQLREGPTKGFGDPTTTVGGNAPRFYSHVRVRVSRVQGSKIVDKGRTLGIKGKIVAKKNKTGGGEGASVGFRLWYYKPLIEFLDVKDVSEEA